MAEGMSVWGGKIEGIWRLGPRSWPVQPALGGHIGVGRVSGSATQYVYSVETGTTEVRRVGARTLFGSEFFPIVGVDGGIAGDFDEKKWTYGLSAGYDHPGLSAGVKLTRWLR